MWLEKNKPKVPSPQWPNTAKENQKIGIIYALKIRDSSKTNKYKGEINSHEKA
jgi:hypothetical protein